MLSAESRSTSRAGKGTPSTSARSWLLDKSLLDDATAFETNWKVSEMINPDGSVTIRRKVSNADGTWTIFEEEFPNVNGSLPADMLNASIPLPADMLKDNVGIPSLQPCESSDSTDSSMSSAATVKTSPSRAPLHSDRSRSSNTALQRQQERWERKIEKLAERDIETMHNSSMYSTAGSSEHREIHRKTEVESDEESSESERTDESSTGDIESPGDLSRPRNPIPFEKSKYPDSKSSLSMSRSPTSTWNDTSGTANDSMGYPGYDTRTMMREEDDEDGGSDSEWSLLLQALTPITSEKGPGAKPSLVPHNYSTSETETSSSERRWSEPETSETDDSSNSEIPHATPIAKPKPRRRYVSKEEGQSNQRKIEALLDLDLRSLNTEESELKPSRTNEEWIVTVRKKSPSDKIGIFVGLKRLACGIRLVVSKVSPDSLFVETPIETGDIVLSINGINFVDDPSTDDALEIVRNTKRKITFIVQKRGDDEDHRSMDELNLPTLPIQHSSERVKPNMSKSKLWNKAGGQTIGVEALDLTVRKTNRTTRRRWEKSDEPDISNLSSSVSGEMTITVSKQSKSQKVGLLLVTRKTPDGCGLFVSQVVASGLFARTPLSVGDMVLSINDINFRELPDAKIASSFIQRIEKDISIVATKSKEWLKGKKKRVSQTRRLVETFCIPAPIPKESDFYEGSYGTSLFGYKPAKILQMTKLNPAEEVGVKVESRPTKWGTLLVVTQISSWSKLVYTDLQVGDVVLNINGVNFGEDVDANRATAILRYAEGKVVIEYQRLLESLTQTESAEIEVSENVKSDGTKCIRTDTINPNGSRLVKIEEICHMNRLDVAIDTNTVASELTGWDTMTKPGSFRGQGTLSLRKGNGKPAQADETVSHTSSFTGTGEDDVEAVAMIIPKEDPGQDVGNNVATLEGAVCVSKISTTGLLLGKHILPGNTILSIENECFRTNPNARNAFAAIVNATEKVTFEILKNPIEKQAGPHDVWDGPKKKWHERLMCTKHLSPSDRLFEGSLRRDELAESAPSRRKMECFDPITPKSAPSRRKVEWTDPVTPMKCTPMKWIDPVTPIEGIDPVTPLTVTPMKWIDPVTPIEWIDPVTPSKANYFDPIYV